jgi:predicted aspartyl protease
VVTFRYRKEASVISGAVLRPVADVILETSRSRIEAAMYIDSGADITIIPLEVGKALGLKQKPSDEILEIKGVSGSGVPYILKKANIIFNGERLKIRLAWALVEEVPLLLGRMDIFPKFKITFDEKWESIIFER